MKKHPLPLRCLSMETNLTSQSVAKVTIFAEKCNIYSSFVVVGCCKTFFVPESYLPLATIDAARTPPGLGEVRPRVAFP